MGKTYLNCGGNRNHLDLFANALESDPVEKAVEMWANLDRD